jgi:hypothetical protein
MSRTQTPPSALTPAVQRRPVTGARRAIPRRIHGARLAITSTARSERRWQFRDVDAQIRAIDVRAADAAAAEEPDEDGDDEAGWDPSKVCSGGCCRCVDENDMDLDGPAPLDLSAI